MRTTRQKLIVSGAVSAASLGAGMSFAGSASAAGDYSEYDSSVNVFRVGKYSSIAKAFDEVKQHLVRQDAEIDALKALVASTNP